MRIIKQILFSLPFIILSLNTFAINIYMIGDSTMADKSAEVYPETGWGQALKELTPDSVHIFNYAINGRSSKSFIDQGHWDNVLSQLRAGDYVIIQFGHNDQKQQDPTRYTEPNSGYRINLIRFIDQTRATGAIPILATSICRRHFNEKSELLDSHGDYPNAMRAVAKEKNVYLVDLQKQTETFLKNLGDQKSIPYFLHVEGGQYPHYPTDLQDNTHLSPLGAKTVASFFIEQVQRDSFVLANYLADNTVPKTLPLWPDTPPVAAIMPGGEKYEDERVYNVRIPQLLPRLLKSSSKNKTAPAVIIFPGGGYQKLSIVKEGEEIANWLNSIGIHALIVKYRMQEFAAPAPLLDAQQAVRLVRKNAKDWHIDKNKIGVIGFSAGGHVAASVSQHFAWKSDQVSADWSMDKKAAAISARPDFSLLIYPVISMRESITHIGSRNALLGSNPSEQALGFYSLDENINPSTPPTFIIHAGDDGAVPAANAVRYWQALQTQNIPVELLLYQRGGHGFGLRPGNGHTAFWPVRAEEWMRDLKIIQ